MVKSPDSRRAASAAAAVTSPGMRGSETSTPSWTTPMLAVAQSEVVIGAATPTAPFWSAPAVSAYPRWRASLTSSLSSDVDSEKYKLPSTQLSTGMESSSSDVMSQ